MTPCPGDIDVAIAAIYRSRLEQLADDHPLADVARDTCRSIGEQVDVEHRRVVDLLADAGVATPPPTAAGPMQRHEFVVPVGGGDVDRAIVALEAGGYERHLRLGRGAERSLRRHAHERVLARHGAQSTVLRLRWGVPRHVTTLTRIARPTAADWDAIALPTTLAWLYPAIRVIRLVTERLGVAGRDHDGLEPFLVTPMSLVGPLLDVAEVSAHDVVVDIGCGDGRILFEAVERRNCRAIGVERDPTLATRAATTAADRGLGERVTIVPGSGTPVAADEATAVLLFLPLGIASRIVPELLRRLRPGSRIVVHEQSALPAGFAPPETSVPIITGDAVTVAHRWTVGSDRSRVGVGSASR